MISSVPFPLVPKVWGQLGPMFGRALRHGQGDAATEDDILQSLASGESTMWAVHEGDEIVAGLVFSITQHSTGKKLLVEYLGGKNFDEWVGEMETLLEEYRELVGAMCVEASCRRGLAQKLAQRGWKTKAVIMEAPK